MKLKTKYRDVKPAMTGLFLLLTSISVWAQQPVIRASLDSAQIQIGEQTLLHLEIAANKDSQLQLPLVSDTLMKNVEVLNISIPDTIDIGNNRIQIKYDYLITSFDSALYMLPPFQLVAGLDTVYSNELALKVSTMQVDTESGQFCDIKDVLNPRWVLQDYLPIVGYVVGIWLLAALITYIILRLKKHKPILPFRKEEVIILPPHVRAIQALDAIKEAKLWQRGEDKKYHSQVSDVIREYIVERLSVNAMEMTSDEILRALRGISDVDFVYNNLKQLLLLADLVKFAKYHPLSDESELSLMNAYLFVNNTTPVEVNVEPENENKEEKETI